MIDVFNEDCISLTQATKCLPAVGGKRPHVATVWRWCVKGIGGVTLEHSRLGRKIITSKQALSRFGAALADADKSPREPAVATSTSGTRTAARRRTAIAAAEARLAERGI